MAGITHFGRTVLEIVNGNLNAVCYRDEILVAIVQPFIAHQTFQQDNARYHVYATSFLHRITLMFYHGLHYRPICCRLSTYEMNLINECVDIHNNLNPWIN